MIPVLLLSLLLLLLLMSLLVLDDIKPMYPYTLSWFINLYLQVRYWC